MKLDRHYQRLKDSAGSVDFTEFTDATNDVAADGISEHRLTPIQLTIQSKQTLFFYVHDHETVNYSQRFVNLATGVHTKMVPYRPVGRCARQP